MSEYDDDLLREMEDICLHRDPEGYTVLVCRRRLARAEDILALCTTTFGSEEDAMAEKDRRMALPHWRPIL